MNARTKKLDAIFHAASELRSSEEREKYLAEACAGDDDLRREVEALLKVAPIGDELFRPCEESSRRAQDGFVAVIEQAGSVIGRYKLLEKIGEGGMGVVYMAEQEHPVRRKVALKIIKLGMDTRSVVARFEAERQALAMMDHPHIAQVLDAGATEAGRPYFVMELVQGAPITQFCETNQLSLEERLRLFVPVCEAIQSAHQKGIIHRDIKPSNVLVTLHNGAPHPMVIDFGVAKAVDQKLTEKTLFTNFATMIGTPAYMSPEQAEMSKLDVDTRSDIYSLGVLLYELLTGTTPLPEERLRSVAYGEMQRIIMEEEPERPSTRSRKRASPKSQIASPKSQIDADLDWIVMKCLEKDRDRRYETANSLAADLQRHLNDEPIVARPPSVGYRFQKFAQRNKAAFAAVGVIAAVLVSAAVLSTWQAIRATRAERSSRALKDFLLDHVLRANPYVEPEPDPNRLALLERVAHAVDTKFTNQPVIEAELRMVLAGAFAAVGDQTNGLIQSLKAFEIRRRELGLRHSDTLWSLSWVAQSQMGAPGKTGVRKLLEDVLADIRKSRRPLSSGDAEVVWTYGVVLYREDNRPSEALPYMREAVKVCRKIDDPRDYRFKNKLELLARVTELAGHLEEAEKMWRDSLEEAERQFSPDHILVAQFKKQFGGFLGRRGRPREAIPFAESALPIYRRVLGTNHFHTVDTEIMLGDIYDQVDQEAAVRLYAGAYPRLANFFPRGIGRERCRQMADYFVRHQHYAEASRVLELLHQSFQTDPPNEAKDRESLLQSELLLAQTLEQKGRFGEALKAYLHLQPLWANAFPQRRSEAFPVARFLGAQGHMEEANAILAAMLASFETNRPASRGDFISFVEATAAAKGWPAAADLCRRHFDAFAGSPQSWRIKATVFSYVGDRDRYREAMAKALALVTTRTNRDDSRTILMTALLEPASWTADGGHQREVQALANGLKMALSDPGANTNGYMHRTLALAEFRLGRPAEGLAHLEKASVSSLTPAEQGRAATIKALCLHGLGRNDEAVKTLAEADELAKSSSSGSVHRPFLDQFDLYYRILRRETEATINGK